MEVVDVVDVVEAVDAVEAFDAVETVDAVVAVVTAGVTVVAEAVIYIYKKNICKLAGYPYRAIVIDRLQV